MYVYRVKENKNNKELNKIKVFTFPYEINQYIEKLEEKKLSGEITDYEFNKISDSELENISTVELVNFMEFKDFMSLIKGSF